MLEKTVTMSALLRRINRRLAHDYEVLKKSRHNSRYLHNTGLYYRIDCNRNLLIQMHVDPEEFGRDLGVLQPHETVIDPDDCEEQFEWPISLGPPPELWYTK